MTLSRDADADVDGMKTARAISARAQTLFQTGWLTGWLEVVIVVVVVAVSLVVWLAFAISISGATVSVQPSDRAPAFWGQVQVGLLLLLLLLPVRPLSRGQRQIATSRILLSDSTRRAPYSSSSPSLGTRHGNLAAC